MTEFKFTQRSDGGILYLGFEGSIDEDAKFPPLEGILAKKIIIDLFGVRAINSVGIREWLSWIRPVATKVEIQFERCQKSIVLQFNMVEGFLPVKASVGSFYVPFFCDKCGYEGSHLFKVGSDVQTAGKSVTLSFDPKTAAKCVQEKCEIEMDVTESKYFNFLKR